MKHSSISIILALYVVLAATYSFVTPLGEGPDEQGHAAYVFFLARERRLPDQRINEVPGEGHQPPLAYMLAAPALVWLPQAERAFDLPGNSRFLWAGGDQVNAAAHGSREFWPWQGGVLAWHLARLVSVACGAVTVGMTWLAARRLQIVDCRLQISEQPTCLQPAIPLLAASLVAFNPQFLFVSGLVSNDALLAALGAVAVWLCIRGQGSGVGNWEIRTTPYALRNAVALGLVLGLALLTKQSALIFVPMIVLATVRWSTLKEITIQRFLVSLSPCLLVFAVAGFLAGWWYLRNWQLYGDPLGLAMFQAEFTTQPFDFTSLAAWRDALVQLHNSFWARFGWMNLTPPAWAFVPFVAIELCAVVGCVLGVRGQGSRVRGHGSLWTPLLILVGTTFVWLLAFARTAGLVAWQGRLLFPAISAIAILLAAGFQGLGVRGCAIWWRVPAGMFIAAIFASAVWLPFGVIGPAYPPQTLSESTALARLGTAVYGRFGLPGDQGAELRGYSLQGEMKPGATLDLRLIWHARGRQNRDWTVFVHVVDSQGRIVAQSNGEPRAGAFPMGQWVAGDWVEDFHSLKLPNTLAPGSYSLRAGLFDARGTQERTGVWDEQGRLVGDFLELGIRLTPVTKSRG